MPKFEIGYWCSTRFSGQGYTTEAVRGIAALAFEALGAKRVEIRCDPLNRLSARVAERAGFRLQGELRNDALGTDGRHPAQHAPLLRHTARSRRTAFVTHYRQDEPKGL